MTVLSQRPMRRVVVILVATLAVTACGGATSGPDVGAREAHSGPPASPTAEPSGAGVAERASSPPPLTLYVSNQSFEDPDVRIAVAIDDEAVVDQRFAVEGQHNWIRFDVDVPPGDHTLMATSDTGAELTVDFATPAGRPRWAAVGYWWSPGEGPRRFTFSITDEPLSFE